MPNRPIAPSSRAQSQPSAIPLQSFQFSKEQLQDPAVMNVAFQQILTALNQVNGTLGPVVLPSGIDVAGAPITNVGAPQGPTDAISSGHAQGNYSPEVVGPQLDVGGKNALKGLNAAYALAQQASSALAAGVSGTVTLAKITGGGTNGSITFVGGVVTGFVQPT